MPEKTPLYQYVSQALSTSGAVVDTDGKQLQCLLPPELAQELVTDEEFTLVLPGMEKEGQVLNYEHPLLEHLFDHIQQEGRLAHIVLSDLNSRSGGLRNAFQRTVQLDQGIGEIERIHTGTCGYLLMHFRINAQCQDISYSELTSLACNEETLIQANWLTETITSWPHQSTKPLFWSTPFPVLYDHLQNQLNKTLETVLQPFYQNIFQQISRQRRRIERLHRRERKEILRPLKEDPTQDFQPTLAALEDASTHYIESLEAIPPQFPIAIQITPLAALRVSIPVTRVEYNIRLRKNSRTISWLWNPILEQFEPLRCENCGVERYHLTPTPELALHCPACT